MDAKSLLLMAAFHHSINEPNIEAGYERFQAVAGEHADYQSFCDAVTACLREGLIREPIRLPEGALQCHWHLELTPRGVELARQLARLTPPRNPLPQGEGENITNSNTNSPSPCGRGLRGGVTRPPTE